MGRQLCNSIEDSFHILLLISVLLFEVCSGRHLRPTTTVTTPLPTSMTSTMSDKDRMAADLNASFSFLVRRMLKMHRTRKVTQLTSLATTPTSPTTKAISTSTKSVSLTYTRYVSVTKTTGAPSSSTSSHVVIGNRGSTHQHQAPGLNGKVFSRASLCNEVCNKCKRHTVIRHYALCDYECRNQKVHRHRHGHGYAYVSYHTCLALWSKFYSVYPSTKAPAPPRLSWVRS